jgi:hypothetical protein
LSSTASTHEWWKPYSRRWWLQRRGAPVLDPRRGFSNYGDVFARKLGIVVLQIFVEPSNGDFSLRRVSSETGNHFVVLASPGEG